MRSIALGGSTCPGATAARVSRRVGSVCSGVFVLAGAGLLDGRAATTHWAFCEQLGRDFPDVSVEPDRIFVGDGSRGDFWLHCNHRTA